MSGTHLRPCIFVRRFGVDGAQRRLLKAQGAHISPEARELVSLPLTLSNLKDERRIGREATVFDECIRGVGVGDDLFERSEAIMATDMITAVACDVEGRHLYDPTGRRASWISERGGSLDCYCYREERSMLWSNTHWIF
ncbi:hypothetical protein CEP51_002115 [Fusarium floridanum]|uniref:Uncharacterized protein n=1 Tax=Fusarium floridanum TaxID=1325733 RepID=A0A428SCY8_9HYPO|nr:hypothetical protein CEP51_002115 [Fusarium floridanum]